MSLKWEPMYPLAGLGNAFLIEATKEIAPLLTSVAYCTNPERPFDEHEPLKTLCVCACCEDVYDAHKKNMIKMEQKRKAKVNLNRWLENTSRFAQEAQEKRLAEMGMELAMAKIEKLAKEADADEAEASTPRRRKYTESVMQSPKFGMAHDPGSAVKKQRLAGSPRVLSPRAANTPVRGLRA